MTACANPECDHDRSILSPGCALRDCPTCGHWTGSHDAEGCRTISCRCRPSVPPLVNALAERMLRDHFGSCELVSASGSERCPEPVVAARFEGGFVDLVCAEHAERAAGRAGAQVVTPTALQDRAAEHVTPAKSSGETVDLLAALQRSVDAAKAASQASSPTVPECPHGYAAPINCGLCAGVDG